MMVEEQDINEIVLFKSFLQKLKAKKDALPCPNTPAINARLMAETYQEVYNESGIG